MIRRLGLTVAVLAVAAGAALGITAINPLQRPALDSVQLPRITRLTCVAAGRALLDGSGDATLTPLGGAGSTVAAPGEATTSGPVGLIAPDLISGGVLVEGPHRAYAPCAAPVTAGVVLVSDPAATELVLVNSDAGEAAVDLTLLGPDGEIAAVGARGIAIAPGVIRRIALSVLAPSGPVGVLFRASQGRVALLATAVEGRPARFVAPGTESTEHLLPGAPTGATSTELLLTNPGEERVEVSLEGLGPNGPYVPAVTDALSIPAMSTLRVSLTGPLAGEATAVRVTAPEPVGAALVTTAGGQPATVVASAAAGELSGVAPGGGQLQLSNPGRSDAVAATVTASPFGESPTETVVTVAPGSTATVPLPEGPPVAVRVTAAGELVAAAVSAAAPGTVVVPLGPTIDAPNQTLPALLHPGLR